MVNSAVVNQVYVAGKAAGADQKVMLALFEACYVETNFENLNHGDRDSVGVLQQRSSWGSVAQRMNPSWAATQFVDKAKAIEGKYSSAGGLAQGVQVSALPGKYSLAAPVAMALLAGAAKNNGDSIPLNPGANGPTVPNLSGLNGAIGSITNGGTWVRVAMFIGGGLLVLFALAKATGNNQLEPSTKNAIKLAATIAK